MRIGVDLGGTKIEAVAMDDAGNIRVRRRVPTPQGDYRGTIEAIRALVDEVEREAGATCTVGIGTPGAISPSSGLMKNCNSTCLNGMPLDRDLSAALGREVRLANDADCLALSEATDGAGAGAPTVFAAILGTGVGGGIVAHGKLLSGPNAIAGEWGHNPLPWPRDDERPGPACYCGRSGCIETFLSGPGFSRDHERRTGSRFEPREILAARSDPHALRTYDDYVDRLARALATLINILDPHVIVLGGGMSNVESLYQDVPRAWGRYVFSDVVGTKLLRAHHGDSSGVRGAAWLWREGPGIVE